jgi:hypothetical protein
METNRKVNGWDSRDAASHLAAVHNDGRARASQGCFHTSAAVAGSKVHRTVVKMVSMIKNDDRGVKL